MPGDQVAVGDDVRLPIGHLGITTAVLFEHVFHQEGNDLGQPSRLLLGIGKAGDRSVLHHGNTTGDLGMAESRRPMADSRHRFARSHHPFNQSD